MPMQELQKSASRSVPLVITHNIVKLYIWYLVHEIIWQYVRSYAYYAYIKICVYRLCTPLYTVLHYTSLGIHNYVLCLLWLAHLCKAFRWIHKGLIYSELKVYKAISGSLENHKIMKSSCFAYKWVLCMAKTQEIHKICKQNTLLYNILFW